MTDPARTLPPARTRLAGRQKLALCLFAILAATPPLAHAAGEPFLIVVATRMVVFAIAALSRGAGAPLDMAGARQARHGRFELLQRIGAAPERMLIHDLSP